MPSQTRLFDFETKPIKGLKYIPEYISEAAESALVERIDKQNWLDDLKRRVQHYGYRYDYKARNIPKEFKLEPVPDWLAVLCEGQCSKKLFNKIPDQVIVNEYQPGQGISPHIDCIPCFEGIISSLSLGSPCVMDFLNAKSAEKVSLRLEPRSLLVLAGEARYEWLHSIPGRKTDYFEGNKSARRRRISLTFRKVIINAQNTDQ